MSIILHPSVKLTLIGMPVSTLPENASNNGVPKKRTRVRKSKPKAGVSIDQDISSSIKIEESSQSQEAVSPAIQMEPYQTNIGSPATMHESTDFNSLCSQMRERFEMDSEASTYR